MNLIGKVGTAELPKTGAGEGKGCNFLKSDCRECTIAMAADTVMTVRFAHVA